MLSENEREMVSYWLKEVAEYCGNRICNDVPKKLWEGWSKEDCEQFLKECNEWNGGEPEDYFESVYQIPDFCLIGFLAHKITKG